MTCREVRELADSFVSEQLLVETNHDVVRHLETCPDCRAEIAGRRAIRAGLRGAFGRAADLQPRPEFAAELASKLRKQPTIVSRRAVLQSWWAVAAGVAVAAGGGALVLSSRSRRRLALLAREAAGDHDNCAVAFHLAERPISLEEAARRYGGPYGALATFDIPRTSPHLDAVARHACVFQGRRFGHVVLHGDRGLISLLVTEGPVPGRVELQTPDSRPAVVALPAGRFVAFLVADLESTELVRLADAFAGPLSQHLA